MKLAHIKFSFLTILNQGLDIFLLRDILMSLPSDTKLYSIFFDNSSTFYYLTITSNSFIDEKPGTDSPEILVHLVQNPSKTGWLLASLDMSAALPACALQKAYNPVCLSGTNCGICSVCVPGSFPSIVPPTFTKTMSPNFTIPSEYSLAGTNTGGFTGGCNHSWKNYQGLNESFEYCVTCNEKKK